MLHSMIHLKKKNHCTSSIFLNYQITFNLTYRRNCTKNNTYFCCYLWSRLRGLLLLRLPGHTQSGPVYPKDWKEHSNWVEGVLLIQAEYSNINMRTWTFGDHWSTMAMHQFITKTEMKPKVGLASALSYHC